MKRDALDFVPIPQRVLSRLRKIALGGALTGLGLFSTTVSANPLTPSTPLPAALSPTIVDRSKKTAKLILQLPGRFSNLVAQHRSHSSHSSHRSHSSHVSGAGGAVAPAPPKTASPSSPLSNPPASTAEAAPLADFAGLPWVDAVVEAMDRQTRSMRVKATKLGTTYTVTLKDDTLFETSLGQRTRWDDYLDANSGRYPFGLGDKIQFSWRQNATTKAVTAIVIVRAK